MGSMVRKLLLASVLLLAGCDAKQSSSVIGELIAFECGISRCNAVVYSKGLFDSFSVDEISTCNEDYSTLIGTKVAIVRYPAEVPVVQKTETTIRQCNRIYQFKVSE